MSGGYNITFCARTWQAAGLALVLCVLAAQTIAQQHLHLDEHDDHDCAVCTLADHQDVHVAPDRTDVAFHTPVRERQNTIVRKHTVAVSTYRARAPPA